MRNILTIAATALALVLGFGLAASAATTGCSGAPAGDCNSQVNAHGNAFTVGAKTAAVNTNVIAAPDSASGKSDFIADQTTNNADERTFEYAPAGQPSGLCISQPAGWRRLVLRDCRNSIWQRFTGTDTRDTAGTQWVSEASGQTVQGAGNGHPFAVVTTVTNRAGSYFGFGTRGLVPAP